MRKSAAWAFVDIMVGMMVDPTSWRVLCQRTARCLLAALMILVVAHVRQEEESSWMVVGWACGKCASARRCLSCNTALVHWCRAMYSAALVELAVSGWSFESQHTAAEPSLMM